MTIIEFFKFMFSDIKIFLVLWSVIILLSIITSIIDSVIDGD